MILKYLELSTAHLATDTIISNPYFLAEYEEGLFVYVPTDIESDCPEELANILRYAKSQHCNLVRFDSDAAISDRFILFDR